MRVLLIEDEQRVAEIIACALREGPGYAVDIAADGRTGNSLASDGVYDLVVLDLMLPGRSGLEVLQRIRSRGDRTPVLILTAQTSKGSTVALLNAGADDYLAKPYDLGELIARIKTLIRRGKGVASPVFALGDLKIDTLEKSVKRSGTLIELSPMEYRILEYMVHKPRAVISKRQLLEHLYDYNWERHSNVIEAHISNLRRKLDADSDLSYIQTLRGQGYRLTQLKGETDGKNEIEGMGA